MPRMDQEIHSIILDTYWRYARIDSIDSANDLASITILDANDNPTSETYSNVPIFYHCIPDAVVRGNGALEGAASAFAVSDKAIVKFEDLVPKIIGRKDGLRACMKGIPVVYPTTYEFIGPENPPGGVPELEVTGLVRQLDVDGFRLATEIELRTVEIEIVVPALSPPITVQFYINDIEITDFLWKSSVWFASTDIPDTWKMHVLGAVDLSDYDKRIKLRVRYTGRSGQKDYEYEPLQLVTGYYVNGHVTDYSVFCGAGFTATSWALWQGWAYDGRYFRNNRRDNNTTITFGDWQVIDASGCTPPERKQHAGATFKYDKNSLNNAYLRLNTSNVFLSGCCYYLWAEDFYNDVYWPDTFQINFDAPSGTDLGNLIDAESLRTKWEETFPLVQDMTFDEEATQWHDRPY